MENMIGKMVRPKSDMEDLKLSKNKEYKVLNFLFEKYQIENDWGIIDYYSPKLFQQPYGVS